MTTKTLAVLGVGPGLGMSVARRFAAEGWSVALVSRTDARHAGYRADLPGVPVHTYAADLTDPAVLADVVARAEVDLGGLGAVYYGPAAAMPGIVPLPEADASAVAGSMDAMLLPAVRTASLGCPACWRAATAPCCTR
jgi:NAD(P)-dependent dehydrogenase (short-subunit alcohol dehydrogenase family)